MAWPAPGKKTDCWRPTIGCTPLRSQESKERKKRGNFKRKHGEPGGVSHRSSGPAPSWPSTLDLHSSPGHTLQLPQTNLGGFRLARAGKRLNDALQVNLRLLGLGFLEQGVGEAQIQTA